MRALCVLVVTVYPVPWARCHRDDAVDHPQSCHAVLVCACLLPETEPAAVPAYTQLPGGFTRLSFPGTGILLPALCYISVRHLVVFSDFIVFLSFHSLFSSCACLLSYFCFCYETIMRLTIIYVLYALKSVVVWYECHLASGGLFLCKERKKKKKKSRGEWSIKSDPTCGRHTLLTWALWTSWSSLCYCTCFNFVLHFIVIWIDLII